MLIPKNKPIRDKAHLAFVRSLVCCKCLSSEGIQSAHLRCEVPAEHKGGTALKSSDIFTTPLCAECHREQHQNGEISFWGSMGRPIALSAFLYEHTGQRTPCVFEIMKFAREFKRVQ